MYSHASIQIHKMQTYSKRTGNCRNCTQTNLRPHSPTLLVFMWWAHVRLICCWMELWWLVWWINHHYLCITFIQRANSHYQLPSSYKQLISVQWSMPTTLGPAGGGLKKNQMRLWMQIKMEIGREFPDWSRQVGVKSAGTKRWLLAGAGMLQPPSNDSQNADISLIKHE